MPAIARVFLSYESYFLQVTSITPAAFVFFYIDTACPIDFKVSSSFTILYVQSIGDRLQNASVDE
jgi:hypothetical protein